MYIYIYIYIYHSMVAVIFSNSEAVKSRQVGFDNSADSYHEEVHLINYQSVHQTDVRRVII